MEADRVVPDPSKVKHPAGHRGRVKCIAVAHGWVITGDTNGALMLWRPNPCGDGGMRLDYVASANCQGRITTMAAIER